MSDHVEIESINEGKIFDYCKSYQRFKKEHAGEADLDERTHEVQMPFIDSVESP